MKRTVSTGALPLVCAGLLAACSVAPETTRQITDLPNAAAQGAAFVPGGTSGASVGFRQAVPHAVAFAEGSSVLTPFAEHALAVQADWLLRHRDAVAVVTGYADTASEGADRGLARDRANAARDYLVMLGMPRHMIRAVAGNAASVFGADGHMRIVVTDIDEERESDSTTGAGQATASAGGTGSGSGGGAGGDTRSGGSDGAPTSASTISTGGPSGTGGGASSTGGGASSSGGSGGGSGGSSGGNSGTSSGGGSGGSSEETTTSPPETGSSGAPTTNNNGNGKGKGSQSNAGRGNGAEGSDPGNSGEHNRGGDDD
jgi:hypothetical protein